MEDAGLTHRRDASDYNATERRHRTTQKQRKHRRGLRGPALKWRRQDRRSSLAKAAAVGRCVLKADDGARVVLRAVAAEAPTKVKRSFFSSLVLLASVLYTIYALGLKAIFAIPLYAATLQKAYELLPEKVDDDRVAFSLTLEPPPRKRAASRTILGLRNAYRSLLKRSRTRSTRQTPQQCAWQKHHRCWPQVHRGFEW